LSNFVRKATHTVQVRGPDAGPRVGDILTPEALDFVARLHRRFNSRRLELLQARSERQISLDAGAKPNFLPGTHTIRTGAWRVGSVPHDLQDRRVEITGPVDRKMVINALNSGARCFMADFEDSHSPTWRGTIEGQANLIDAIERTIELKTDSKTYELHDNTAVLLVRPRGWHLQEKHLLVDDERVSASLFDFGLYFFHNHARLKARGTGPYFYLPKLESHLEARLWNDVFVHAQQELGVPVGTIKVTVLIETVLAAFEMDEILFELRDHIVALNAGRWDYIFSIIKKFRNTGLVLPDRQQLTMTVPFMRAYTELLVQTCHKRGAHAMGGMAAFVPSRKDAKVNENAMNKVREDKVRESNDGFDGTWVAHPDLVPLATEVFDHVLGSRANQVGKTRADVHVTAPQLLDFRVPNGEVTEAGLTNNVDVSLQYLDSWLQGSGAVAIHNLMEDAATAEIARSQVWQWVKHGKFSEEHVRQVISAHPASRSARDLFAQVALSHGFPEFLTLPAYERLE